MTRSTLLPPASLRVLAPLLLVSFAAAQTAVITEQRVRQTVGWLADDARGGRDTPSAGLEAAADWIAERFAAAKLHQIHEDSWFHRYTLPGLSLDSDQVEVTLAVRVATPAPAGEGKPPAEASERIEKVVLRAGEDVRLWRAGEAVLGSDEPCTVADAGDPALERMLMARSARTPTFLLVDADHPLWPLAAGRHQLLGGRRAAARPIFLVQRKALPAAALAAAKDQKKQWTTTWATPGVEKLDLPLRNVVALLPGSDRRDEYVVVSGHYDHVGIGVPVDGDAVRNGADDNATGAAAVILLAEALAQAGVPLRRSVLFVCFSAEEKGLLGSRAFVANPPVPLERIVANVNLEMLGRPEPGKEGKAWVTGAGYSDFAAIVAPALARAGVGTIEFGMANQLFRASDNLPFAERGIVAHSISAGSLHQDYHQPGDQLEKLDIPHMTKVVAALREAVVDLANRDERPAWSEAGRKVVEQLQSPTRGR